MFGFGGSKKKEEKKEDKKTENVDMHISDTSNYNKGLDNPSDRVKYNYIIIHFIQLT